MGQSNTKSIYMYGKAAFGSVPVHFQQLHLDGDVLSYLQADEMFNAPVEALENFGFSKEIDYPTIPDHIYYEGYMHSKEKCQIISSMHPRNGRTIEKLPASLQLASFCEAFRRCNAVWCTEAQQLLLDEGTSPSVIMSTILRDGRHFADLAVQLHYGQEIGSKDISWHNDGPNSALHLAVSIRGNRTLNWLGWPRQRPTASVFKFKQSRGKCDDFQEFEDKQSEGDIYVSSPMAFRHGVAYPQSDYASRTIAIQCRSLLTPEDISGFQDAIDCDCWYRMMCILTESMSKFGVSYPTLPQILAVEEELSPSWAVNYANIPRKYEIKSPCL